MFPENLAKSIAEGQILQVAVFAVFFGIALATLSEAKRAPVLRLCESLSEVMFRFTNVVMYFAPIGVGAAMAFTVGHMGLGVLVNLGKLLLTLYGALAVFAVLVLLPVALLFKVPVRGFWRRWRSRRRLRLRRRRARRRCRARWSRWRRWACRGGLWRS